MLRRCGRALISLAIALQAACIGSLPAYEGEASEDATMRGDGATRHEASTGPSPDALQKAEAATDSSVRKDASSDATDGSVTTDALSVPEASVDVGAVDAPPPVDASGCDGGCAPCETCVGRICQYAGNCNDRKCGLDSCGLRSCGSCTGTCETCNGAGVCEYTGSCSGLSCGPDTCGVGGADMCGGCQANYLCTSGQCLGTCYARCCPATSCGDGALEGPWPEATQADCQNNHEPTACPNGGVWKMSWANTEDFYVRSSCPSSC